MLETFLLRAAIVLVLGSLAYYFNPFQISAPVAGGLGVGFGAAVILLERRLEKANLSHLLGAVVGGITALSASLLVSLVLQRATGPNQLTQFVELAILSLGMFVGISLGAKKGEMLNLAALGGILGGEKTSKPRCNVLDTSVIIDGRIADIAETGFIDGVMAIPQFVLRELQLVADSADSLRRNRGRRGLDVLQRLQKAAHVRIQIIEDDFPQIRDVDMKLVELGKLYGWKIVTNDFNLNKVAQLNGVEVLNINELANALKPVVLPGEIMRVFVLKEGKEYNQGVAYLDDGTMVVIDNARRMISKTIDIAVTSVLQTTAGKMIFGKFDERTHSVYDKIHPDPHERRSRETTTAATPHSSAAAPQSS
ncbi:MAG: PIN domain nuclease [Bryobacteraceae bacterium]|nr:PIN domain nuclease [Bryobacteraceae bacterium]